MISLRKVSTLWLNSVSTSDVSSAIRIAPPSMAAWASGSGRQTAFIVPSISNW